MDHQEVWRLLYGRLNTDYNFDAWANRQTNKGAYLDVVEKSGHLENMYAVACATLSPSLVASA